LEGEVSVFEIAQGEDSPRQLTSLLEGDAWQVAEGKLQLQSPADLLVYAYSGESQPVTLQLSLSAPQPDRFLAIDLESRPFIRLYLRQERLDYEVPLSLAPGIHRFTFRPEENCLQDCAPVDISRLAVNHPETDRMAAIPFGKQLSLIKHDLFEASTSPGHPILMFLYWQGHGQLSEDYSAFVHLVSSSGQLITQADYLLGGWLYPTSKWPSDHITAGPTLIFVPAGTPPGEYQIRIGLYRAETGQRLLLNDDFDQQDSVILENIIVNP
jgi:hypothetical protein